MLTKTQKACMMRAVTIFTMMLLLAGVIVGCGTSSESSEQNNSKNDRELELQEQKDKEQDNRQDLDARHEQDSNLVEEQAADGHTTETEVQQPSDSNEKPVRIMIRSDNQITISSQEVLEQLNKEIEQLLKSLDNMDSISDEQLDF